MSGTAVPGDTAATYFFQYGKTNRYGHQSAAEPLGAGAGAIPVNAPLSRLTAHAGYHYRLVATNRAGTSYGADKQFKTRYALRGLALKVVRTGARGYHASGALKLPGGVSKAIGCKGTVTITARHYSRKAGSRTARVTRRCTYSANLSVDLTGRSKISIVATFNGNPTIGPFTPRGVTALFAMQHPRHAPLAAPWSPADEQLSTDRFRPSAPPLGGRPTGRRHHWNYANSDAPEFR